MDRFGFTPEEWKRLCNSLPQQPQPQEFYSRFNSFGSLLGPEELEQAIKEASPFVRVLDTFRRWWTGGNP